MKREVLQSDKKHFDAPRSVEGGLSGTLAPGFEVG
jgi:hypothetical protein